MSISGMSELKAYVALDMGEASVSLSDAQLERACNTALSELSWSLPSKDGQDYWICKRAMRHAVYILLVSVARKFKFNQINLQQRFEHYKDLVKMLDDEFKAAVESSPIMFLSVDASKFFGCKISAGFVYDSIGNDVTSYFLEE